MSARSIHIAPTNCRRVIISANPNAGSRSGTAKVEDLAELLRRRDFEVVTSTDIDEVSKLAFEHAEKGDLRAVVAAGGDGTVALIANHTPPDTPIAILPLGTENLLAKYIGIWGTQTAASVIAAGASVRLDAGLADDRIFLLMVSCGFDADVVRRLHGNRTGHIRHMSYAKPIIDSIRGYNYPLLRVKVEGTATTKEVEIESRWMFAVNLPRYAGGLKLVPEAVGSDGLLDVCTLSEGSFTSSLIYLAGVLFGQHTNWSSCEIHQTKKISIESDEPVPYQLDGDPGGFLPLEIEILPERLRLLTPVDWAQKNGFRQ